MPHSESLAWNRVNICRTTAASCSTITSSSSAIAQHHDQASPGLRAGRPIWTRSTTEDEDEERRYGIPAKCRDPEVYAAVVRIAAGS
jgi:hypothetical protein